MKDHDGEEQRNLKHEQRILNRILKQRYRSHAWFLWRSFVTVDSAAASYAVRSTSLESTLPLSAPTRSREVVRVTVRPGEPPATLMSFGSAAAASTREEGGERTEEEDGIIQRGGRRVGVLEPPEGTLLVCP